MKIPYKAARRVVLIGTGFLVLATGIAMIVLPGPAIILIPIGLGILSGEYVWARRLLGKIRALKERSPTSWNEFKKNFK